MQEPVLHRARVSGPFLPREEMMSRCLLIALLAAAFIVAPAVLPGSFGLSGSAQAAKNLNSSRSNVYRTKSGSGAHTDKARMGGGGGRSVGSGFVEPRMGGGGGHGQTK
jgi:hypothetical protein